MPSIDDFRIKGGKIFHYVKKIIGGKNTFVPTPPAPKVIVAADGNLDNIVKVHPTVIDFARLLENGDIHLLESGDFWLLEDEVFPHFILEDGNFFLLENNNSGVLDLQS
jgi:hypothetical protein